MNNEGIVATRLTPRLIFGVGILAVGLLWTLDNLNILESEPYTRWWPAMVILAGAVKLLDVNSGRSTAVALMIAGSLLLLGSLDVIDFDLGDLFPLAIAIIGGKLVYDALRRKPQPAKHAIDPSSRLSATAIMAGIHRQSTSTDFQGGDAFALMGGSEIDLRRAEIPAGGQAVIDAFAFWGGVEITVPETWKIAGDVLPLLGAFEDKTRPVTTANAPTLVIRGTAIMGGIEVKN